MGHAHHFLSRLDRVSLPHLELALSLYNDAPLLLFILSKARIPEGAERVAISLDHPERGPFIIVSREGRFITCLGEGMSPGDHPIITRGQLDALSLKVSTLRERIEDCQKLVGPKGGAGKLFRHIYDMADDLSREDFLICAALQPLFGAKFLNLYFGLGSDLNDARAHLLKLFRKTDKLKPSYHEWLHAYYKSFWALGHFGILTTMSGASLLDIYPGMRDELVGNSLSWPLVRQGIAVSLLKGVHCAARLGKAYLATYKRLHDRAASPFTALDSTLGLAALGMRHKSLRAEVQKALSTGPAIDPETYAGRLAHLYHKGVSTIARLGFEHPEEAAKAQRLVGSLVSIQYGKHLPVGSPYRFESVDDVPEDLAMTAAVNTIVDVMHEHELLGRFLMCLPWVARTTPEQLYFPRDYIKAIRKPWEPSDTYALLAPHRQSEKEKQVEAQRMLLWKKENPARKGPCPCGSGKKYKRCCGTEDRIEEEETE